MGDGKLREGFSYLDFAALAMIEFEDYSLYFG